MIYLNIFFSFFFSDFNKSIQKISALSILPFACVTQPGCHVKIQDPQRRLPAWIQLQGRVGGEERLTWAPLVIRGGKSGSAASEK